MNNEIYNIVVEPDFNENKELNGIWIYDNFRRKTHVHLLRDKFDRNYEQYREVVSTHKTEASLLMSVLCDIKMLIRLNQMKGNTEVIAIESWKGLVEKLSRRYYDVWNKDVELEFVNLCHQK